MERTSPSESYPSLQNTLDEGFAEQRHRDLWLFLYSSRHAHPELWQPGSAKEHGIQERDCLIDQAALLLEKHSPSGPWELFFKKRELAAKLHNFCFCITYAFHKRVLADGFIDIRAESQRALYNDFISTLTRDEIDAVSRLHDLNYKYGFVITELWTSLISSADILEDFVIKNRGSKYLAHNSPFVFPKRGNHLQCIQISTKDYQTAIIEPWDLLVFVDENEILSKTKQEISNSWQLPGNQVIGDQNNHKIAFYVDRKKCSIRNLLDTIKLQIDHLKDYNNGLSLIAAPEDLGDFKKNKAKAKKEAKRNLSSTIDRLRLSEGLIHKRWSVEQSNVRRSVGLYLWDQKNIAKSSRSRKRIITDLIDKLKREKPEALDFYLKNFNKYDSPEQTTKFGDAVGALETVTREMEADYDLTDNCIRNFEFLTPQDVKSRRSKTE